MGKFLIVITSLSGGLVVGVAFVAFLYILGIIPRLIQITDTHNFMKLYEDIYIIGAILFTILYFSELSMRLNKLIIAIAGLLFGIFIGMVSSAITEVFAVVPILIKKLKLKKKLKYLIIAISLGKICGSLYYFIFL